MQTIGTEPQKERVSKIIGSLVHKPTVVIGRVAVQSFDSLDTLRYAILWAKRYDGKHNLYQTILSQGVPASVIVNAIIVMREVLLQYRMIEWRAS